MFVFYFFRSRTVLASLGTYLMVSTLKLPSAKEKPKFSVRGSPKPKVRTDRVRVSRRAMTNRRAHSVNLLTNKRLLILAQDKG